MKPSKRRMTTPLESSHSKDNCNITSQACTLEDLHEEIFSYKKAFKAKTLIEQALHNNNLITLAMKGLKYQLLQANTKEASEALVHITKLETLAGRCYE